jgi:hypothetical protein
MGWRSHRYCPRTVVHDGCCGVDGLSTKDAPHVGKRVNVQVPPAPCAYIADQERLRRASTARVRVAKQVIVWPRLEEIKA